MSDEQERWSAVDDYISGLLVGPDPALDSALEANARAGLPAIDVSPAQGKLLHLLARAIGARSILEIGTLGGYSTIWLAGALPAEGRLVTLERSPVHAKVARENIDRAGLGEFVEVREGPALESLPQLSGPFDFVFVDADKPSNPEYFQWALRLSRPGSVIVVDNVIRGGRVLESDSDDAAVQGTRRFTEMLATEPRVSATEIQTVGSKGHDGFALAVVLDG
ncbi:O-methyltransferase [Pseudonocardia asaccharolytica]|uniref:O-methyltransferase n=1 Tax=Pseudonocardia asaccharolytica DSM 44247 = NBRC 16224 TaxID=1123024 RepID=A0A511D297_9PSEU|nr:O-methyltransferase [Pseudonocardia asaccharolytica]GEL18909.1 O-methyltransferase [Pseudonocardia asaccharolytica DSM 44247 = NBRC 16224]